MFMSIDWQKDEGITKFLKALGQIVIGVIAQEFVINHPRCSTFGFRRILLKPRTGFDFHVLLYE